MNTSVILHAVDQAASWALSSSWAACLPALVLLAAGFWRSFPVRWRIVLAVVVAVRLVLPVVPGLPGHPLGWLAATASPSRVDPGVIDAAGLAESDAVSYWGWLWLAGVACTLGWAITSHFVLKRKLQGVSDHPGEHLEALLAWCCRRADVQARIDFRLVHGLSTPAIYGWRTPMLLLPADIESRHTDDEIRGMIMHELVHIRQGDGLWNWAMMGVCALHWFNPLVWLCLRRYQADREIVCDQGALNLLLPQQRHAYGHALLKTWETVSQHQPALLTPFLRRRTETYTRILMSIQPTRQRRMVQLLALATVPALSLFSLTTVRADREPGKKPAESEEGKKSAEGERETGGRKAPREGDSARKEGVREREGARKGPRDGDTRKGAREGDGVKKEGDRDGASARKGPRDGETRKTGPRDGEKKTTGPRDGEGSTRKGPRDGEGVKKEGARDGDKPKTGEGEREGARKEGEK